MDRRDIPPAAQAPLDARAELYAVHEPDDSGLCPICRVAPCPIRQEVARMLGVAPLRHDVLRGLPP